MPSSLKKYHLLQKWSKTIILLCLAQFPDTVCSLTERYLGTVTMVALTATIVNTTENVISRFNPHERQCFTNEEFYFKNLKWSEGFRYSFTNCIYSVVVDKIFDHCSCIPDFFASFYDKTDYPPCR